DDEDLVALCRSMANQGRGEENGWLQHVRLGYNYRLDEMSAALGCSQLARIDQIVEERARIAAWYAEALKEVEGVIVPAVAFEGRMSWFVYVVRLSSAFGREDRDGILAALSERGIGCSDYFQPIHLQPFLRESLGTGANQFPVTEAVAERTVALPFYVGLSRSNVDLVVDTLVESIDTRGRDR
ncbi:MAG: DegT/DnrJ/EryC1/StrS family aminotransferase, partial [Candidatus Bipolaricaulia bacterium]